jgi:hypothetical protein
MLAELVDPRLRVGEEDRSVGRDDELAALPHQITHPAQHAHLPERRQRRLGLIEHIQPVATEAMQGKCDERLAMRLLVERSAAIGCNVPAVSTRALGRAARSSFARLRKLSARRKNPVRGLRADRTSRTAFAREDSEFRVEKRKFMLPPSGLKPAAIAMASNRVDFPLPLSPTK